VLVERRGHLLEITINRPEQRNCLHPPANDELAQIMDAFLADPDLWVAILTGAGKDAFCTGNDLKYTGQGKPMWVPKTGFGGLTSRVGRTKPVIAAVNGYAMGGGFEISLACDMIVADETAQFALSEVKVGLYAGAGGIVRLPRQLPKKLANELILTGKRLGAADALRLGLVNKVVPAGTALEGARALAAEILEASPTSVRISLQVMNEAEAFPVAVEAVRAPTKAADELMTSEDFFEGLAAFAQKRKPNWKNR
jgi:acetyl-CoA C-acetyltransferase